MWRSGAWICLTARLLGSAGGREWLKRAGGRGSPGPLRSLCTGHDTSRRGAGVWTRRTKPWWIAPLMRLMRGATETRRWGPGPAAPCVDAVVLLGTRAPLGVS
jgi:hypothetical protein